MNRASTFISAHVSSSDYDNFAMSTRCHETACAVVAPLPRLAVHDGMRMRGANMANQRHSVEQVIQRANQSASDNFDSVVTRIVLELFEEQAGSPTIVAVADRAGTNVRTLQRRLESAGVRFRDVLGECRQIRAQRELRNGKRSLLEISERLGYSDPSHFARAFRRWTGYSPSEYRRRMLNGP